MIRFETTAGSGVAGSLAGLYAALMDDEVVAFPGLRPHQRHAWHAFLVQLGATAMYQAGASSPPCDEAEWAALIRSLTPDYEADEPWRLVVDDITCPALLQPPARCAESIEDYRHALETPDQLDMLVTSKNHDLKAAVARDGGPDDWLFALVTLQTMAGFDGSKNYGISRMNGGLGNRPAFSLAPAGGPGAHVRRDMVALLDHRSDLLSDFPLSESGESLLWTLPWEGTRGELLLLNRLAPFYIEVCRRVRLVAPPGGGLSGRKATSQAPRLDASAMKGRTGDPWTPVNRKEGKSLTLSSGGFTYKRMTEYLTSPDWQRPPLLKPTRAEQRSVQGMNLVARAMVRGQGKTEGFHDRSIPLRPRALRALGTAAELQSLGEIASERINEVGLVQRILSHAIQVFLARGERDGTNSEGRELARPWLNRLDAAVDAGFFEGLQDEMEADDGERSDIRRSWLRGEVVGPARELLRDAADTLPCPAIHRYRALVRAEHVFEGRIRGPNGLPFLYAEAS